MINFKGKNYVPACPDYRNREIFLCVAAGEDDHTLVIPANGHSDDDEDYIAEQIDAGNFKIVGAYDDCN